MNALLLPLTAAAAMLAPGQSTTADRAKAFTLDSVAPASPATPAPDPAATPATDPASTPVPTVADGAAAAAPSEAGSPAAAGLRPSFTLDTPIRVLIADPAARAVLDRDLPGLSTDDNLDKFASLGLRQFQPMTGGQLTDAMLVKVARDLSKLSGPMLAPIAPGAAGTSKRNRDVSR